MHVSNSDLARHLARAGQTEPESALCASNHKSNSTQYHGLYTSSSLISMSDHETPTPICSLDSIIGIEYGADPVSA